MKRINFYLLLIGLLCSYTGLGQELKLAVAGTSHGHISFILNKPDKGGFKLVGVYEPNVTLANQRAERYKLSKDLLYHDLNKMLDEVKPDAVVAFGSIYDHLEVVEACAPRGIHVMVEKPLATNMKHAQRMMDLAQKHKIHLLTDYETSWYPTSVKSYQLVHDSLFVGNLRKVVIHDGHKGPKEIGCGPEFLEWLTDPVLNGGGAVVDFGCYGANLMTWLTKGEKPISVSAVLRQFKPDVYPKVDDDATIIVSYPNSQCVIQASWNWPINRKDMEIYGDKGYIFAMDNNTLKTRKESMRAEHVRRITSGETSANQAPVYEDPFSYFADVINGKIKMEPYGLYSPENNLMVVKILDAARKSAKTGKAVVFK